MKKSYSILFILLVLSYNVFSQQVITTKLDALFDKIAIHNKAMGSVSVFKNGKEVYQRSFGYVDIEKNRLANSTTMYKIGSISKVYTSTIILKLIEERKLKLTTKLNQFFPSIPNAHLITIESLLNHSSGLYNYTKKKGFYNWVVEGKSHEELLQNFIKNGIVFQPNERHEYSNTNFVLLALIAEKIHNKPFKDILFTEIITPLQLTRTQIGGKINSENNEAFSYIKKAKWHKHFEWNMDNALGAGSLIATPTEVNTFLDALFTYKLLNKKMVDKMIGKEYFGLGLLRYRFFNKVFRAHGGSIEKFKSIAGYNFDDKLAITVTLNGPDIQVQEIVKAVLAVYYNRVYDLPELNIIKLKNTAAIEGVYKGDDYPHKIKVFREGNTLLVQRTSQNAIPVDAVSATEFKIFRLDASFIFSPEEEKLEFKQKGRGYILYKEKTDN